MWVFFCVDLQMVWMHGEKGEGLSQFYIPHSVAVDNFQRVRLQNIYNPHLPMVHPLCINIFWKTSYTMEKLDHIHDLYVACQVWVADRGNKRIQVFNSVTGDWLGSWGSCFTDDAPYSVR